MLYNVLVAKELRTRMRTRHFMAAFTLYMAVLGVVVIVFLVQHSSSSAGQSSQAGIQLFQALAISQLFVLLLITPASTAGAITSERHRQTWDLLLVTRLSSFEIVWGKLLAGLVSSVVLICASLPFFSSVFLFGGVALEDVLRTYAVFLTTALLVGVTSLFVSVLSFRPAVSVIVSIVVSLLLGVGLSLLVIYLEASPDATGLTILSELGSLPAQLPPLTPLAQIDPVVALLSALPNGNHESLLGGLGLIDHAFGLPLRLPLWGAFGLLTLAITVPLLALSTLLVRFQPPRR